MKRTFKIDIEKCAKCGAPMVLRAMVTAAETVTRFLRRLGEDPEPPPLAPPRKPPFFVSPALRQRLGGLDTAVADASGNGHTATASASAAKLVPGKVEMATQIDVGGYLTVQGPDTLKYAGKSAHPVSEEEPDARRAAP